MIWVSICRKNTPMNKGGGAFLSIIWNGNYPDRVWMWMYNGSLPIWNRNVSAGTCEGRSFKVIDKRSSHYMSFSSHRELYWGGRSWRAHCQNATVKDVKRNPRLIPSIHRTPAGRRIKSQNKAFSALSTKICCICVSYNRMYVQICKKVVISIVLHQIHVTCTC